MACRQVGQLSLCSKKLISLRNLDRLLSICDSSLVIFLTLSSTKVFSATNVWCVVTCDKRLAICPCKTCMASLLFCTSLTYPSTFTSLFCFKPLICLSCKSYRCCVNSISFLLWVIKSLLFVSLSFNKPFIAEKIWMSNKSSMIALRSDADSCMKGTNDAEPRITICVNDL